MQPLYKTDLPPLPATPHICDQAVCSVHGRGFYAPLDEIPAEVKQLMRLIEEVGELIELSPTMKADRIAEESADVLIVLCQLAWLYNLPPSDLMVGEMSHVISLSVLCGNLARAMRKSEYTQVRTILRTMAIHVRQTARIHEIDIEQAMAAKLAKDERRGVRHGEGR